MSSNQSVKIFPSSQHSQWQRKGGLHVSGRKGQDGSGSVGFNIVSHFHPAAVPR